ncbi:LytTR family DNA-binding domain-containing protein [Halocynthiibacter sp.]|uniref:LytTR family DNA-binding domain-containing protein n=1 Tax=Halocynthiibacter sp. TaxID=1979210 RepID=UPI003C38C8CD
MAGYQAFQRGFKRAVKGHERPEEVTWQNALPNILFYGALISLLISLMEPESSQGLHVIAAYLHWFLHFTFAACLWLGAFMMMVKYQVNTRALPWLAIAIMPFIFALVSLSIDIFSGTEVPPENGFRDLHIWYLGEFIGVADNGVIIGVVMTLVIYAVDAAEDKREVIPAPLPSSEPAPPPALHRLFTSITPDRDTKLIRAEAQDHYVALITTTATYLELMPFTEAVEKLSVYNGLQCHRSHWVMRDQVHDLRRAGSAWECKMENGDIVPVSRRRARDVRETLMSV